MLKKIEFLREKLYHEIDSSTLLNDEVIKLSQELDLLILEYYNRVIQDNDDLLLPEYDKGSWFI